MRAFLRRCGNALVMGSLCLALLCAALSYLLGFIGLFANHLSNCLALRADDLLNHTARKRRSE